MAYSDKKYRVKGVLYVGRYLHRRLMRLLVRVLATLFRYPHMRQIKACHFPYVITEMVFKTIKQEKLCLHPTQLKPRSHQIELKTGLRQVYVWQSWPSPASIIIRSYVTVACFWTCSKTWSLGPNLWESPMMAYVDIPRRRIRHAWS